MQKVIKVISQWKNPFVNEKADDLVSLSSGFVASDPLKEDLLKTEEKGKSALVLFDRLTSSAIRFETLPRLKLGKFGEVKKELSAGGKSFVLQANRNLFAWLLVIGRS